MVKRDRILIKTKIPYLRNLIGNGIEFTYKPGCVGSGEGWKYWRNFGEWTKYVRRYKIVILGENGYNFDVSRYIKRVNPKCKVIVYFWNKIAPGGYQGILNDPNVDEYYTFDEEDAANYQIKLCTSFYSKDLKLPKNKIENDVLFVGRPKDRKEDVQEVEKIIKKEHFLTDFRIIEDEKNYIDYYDYLELVSKTKAILDFNVHNQTGISLRVMESIYFKKKLITSNTNIVQYPFYNPKNIFIIGVDSWKNFKKFMNSSYEEIDEEILRYYDFEEWIQRFEEGGTSLFHHFKKKREPIVIPEVDQYRIKGVKIGRNFTNIGPVDFSSEPYLIEIGNDVRISMNVHFVTHDGGMHVLRQYKKIPADSFGRIKVGNNVFIGMNAIIMPGVEIGDNVIIGAGSIVTKSIPSNSVACGVPAKVIESIDDYYKKNKDCIDLTKNLTSEEKEQYLREKFQIK